MGYRVGLLALLLSCSGAFANFIDDAGTFKGGGVWKTPDGYTGKWTETMVIAKDEKGVSVKETLSIETPEGKQVDEWEWSVVAKQNGFFDIMTEGKKTGEGHCFEGVCQITGQSKEANGSFGETLGYKDGMLHVLGYDMHGTMRVSWAGSLKRE